MRALATKLKDWWHRRGLQPAPAVPFAVDCVCGKKLTGVRLATEQIIRCPACAAERFIFPRSPLPAPHGENATASSPRPTYALWLVPAAAVALTIAGLVVAYRIFLAGTGNPETAQARRLPERLEQVRKYLRAGSFRRAALEAKAIAASGLAELPRADQKAAGQLLREAQLFGDLVDIGLEDLVERAAAATDEQEWQLDFVHRYDRKNVLLDVIVRQDGGSYRVTYPLRAGMDEARLEVSELKVMTGLDLERPRRLLFGASLASIRAEPPGPVWVVRFHPDSGVLITDAAAAERCCPAWSDVDTRSLLETQRNWARQLP